MLVLNISAGVCLAIVEWERLCGFISLADCFWMLLTDVVKVALFYWTFMGSFRVSSWPTSELFDFKESMLSFLASMWKILTGFF